MREWLFIALGGALGALSRFGIHELARRFWIGAIGTLAVNTVGCFLIAFLLEHPQLGRTMPQPIRLGLAVGFLGAFTTFSTFGYESFRFLEQQQYSAALLNIGGNLLLGLSGVWAGIRLAAA